MEVSSSECVAEIAHVASESVPTVPPSATEALAIAQLSAVSTRMSTPRIEPARAGRGDCRPPVAELLRVTLPDTRVATTSAPLPRLGSRSKRSDRTISLTPLTRGSVRGGVTPTVLTQAMRALVSRTGLPPRSLRLLGVFGGVPLAPISRLEVERGGKRVRLWYSEGARAPGAARLAVARGLDAQRVYAAVLPPE